MTGKIKLSQQDSEYLLDKINNPPPPSSTLMKAVENCDKECDKPCRKCPKRK